MESIPEILLSVGGILLIGLVVDVFGRYTALPRVTLLLLLGVVVGQELLDIIPSVIINKFELVADVALLMIGFLLGGKLTKASFEEYGKEIVFISLAAVVVCFTLVFLGLYSFGVPLGAAIIVSCIATATDPAACSDVVLEQKKETRFSKLLLAIVAIDDAWALLIFSMGISVVLAISGGFDLLEPIRIAAHDIGGAIILGVVLGFPAAAFTGKIKPGQPSLMEALGLVFLCGGLAMYLEVSFLISVMVLGAMIANLAKHHEYAFHEIENIEWPFMVVFFILAGASLKIDSLVSLGGIGIIYLLSRTLGKYIGARIGSKLARADPYTEKWMGLSLLPQGGASMGMALVASHYFPEHGQFILSIIISGTVIFEIVGPIVTRFALNRDEVYGES